MSFKESLETFTNKIEYVRRASMGVPKLITINLALAEVDRIYDVSGNMFYVWSAPDETSYVTIKVNNTREPGIPFYHHTGLETPFDKLVITTPAGQTGDLVLMYGTEAPQMLQIIDNRSALSLDTAAILEQLRGDVTPDNWGEFTAGVAQIQLLAANANRKGFSVCSDIDNAGNIYLGFDNTVTTRAGGNIWVHCLVPGGSYGIDDYRGPVHAIATAANQYIGVGEW